MEPTWGCTEAASFYLWRRATKNNFSDTLDHLTASRGRAGAGERERKKAGMKTRIQITIFCVLRAGQTIKLKWKLFFFYFTPHREQQKNSRRKSEEGPETKRENKLLTILQQQFASHWQAGDPAVGKSKIWKNCYSLSSPQFLLCKLNLN